MRKPVLLLALLSAACAPAEPVQRPGNAARETQAHGTGRLPDALCTPPAPPQSVRLPQGAFLPPSTPPPPVPPPPPGAAAFLLGPEPVLTGTGDERLDAYLKDILEQGGPGWRPYLLRAFAPVRARPAILHAHRDLGAPMTAADYVRRYVTPGRIAEGRRLYAELQGTKLFRGEQRVPLEVMLALWGVMSDYGRQPPLFDMIEVLAHAGACGRAPNQQPFAIFEAVQILAEGRVPREVAKAYPEGRIGQVRWLTDQYLSWGKDGDGDGVVDVWTNRADILANLNLPGWEGGAPVLVEVKRPAFDRADPAQRRMAQAIELGGRNVGVSLLERADGRPWPAEARSWGGSYVEPFGMDGPAYFLSRNHMPVNYLNPFRPRYWNAEEDPGFGISVGLLADAIAGRPGPTRPIG
jgi:membrane-bound lytic murein transglycosylase B